MTTAERKYRRVMQDYLDARRNEGNRIQAAVESRYITDTDALWHGLTATEQTSVERDLGQRPMPDFYRVSRRIGRERPGRFETHLERTAPKDDKDD